MVSNSQNENTRARRLAKRIAQVVATALEHQIKDPRLDFVTITDTRLTGDLREATIFYTVLNPNEPDKSHLLFADVAQGFEKAKGQIRSIVGSKIEVRYTPSISFVRDDLSDQAKDMESAIDAARARDRDIANYAVKADYAGDKDPYKS